MTTTIISSFDDMPLYMTVAETSEVLRIGRNLCYNLVRCGQLPSIRFGKQIRIPKSALAEYIDGQKSA